MVFGVNCENSLDLIYNFNNNEPEWNWSGLRVVRLCYVVLRPHSLLFHYIIINLCVVLIVKEFTREYLCAFGEWFP